MAALNTENNFVSPDDFYERLIDAHRDLSTQQSHAMNAALVLLLANHIGDMQVIEDAFNKARQTVQTPV
jgi:hypothetical protein